LRANTRVPLHGPRQPSRQAVRSAHATRIRIWSQEFEFLRARHPLGRSLLIGGKSASTYRLIAECTARGWESRRMCFPVLGSS